MLYHGQYGVNQLTDLGASVTKTVAALRPHRHRFDSIAVQGMSGVLVGSPAALRLRKPLVVVRKEFELRDSNCHSCERIINFDHIGKRYLIIDDFTSRFRTVNRIQDVVLAVAESPRWFESRPGPVAPPSCAGWFLYAYGDVPAWSDPLPGELLAAA